MVPDQDHCKAFWASFLASLPVGDPKRAAWPDAFAFGGGSELANELAALVLAGRKRATASIRGTPCRLYWWAEATPNWRSGSTI